VFQVAILTLEMARIGHCDNASTRFRRGCRKPRKQVLLAQLINATLYHHRVTKTLRTTGHYNASECSENAAVDWLDGRSRPLKERSLCPWTVQLGPRRHNTFPRFIAEVRCICMRCQMEGSTHQCHPVYDNNHKMIILRKTRECDERNFRLYEPVRYLVAVGCACVDASVG